MKTKEELSIRNYTVIEQRGGNNMSEEKLNELKEKVAGLQEELKELTPEEIEKVFGGGDILSMRDPERGRFLKA